MAIKDIIAQGIGFNPGSVKFIPTLGFSSSGAAPVNEYLFYYHSRMKRSHDAIAKRKRIRRRRP